MRKLVVGLLSVVFAYHVYADDGGRKQGERYCAKMKDGMMRVVFQEEPIRVNIMLPDGTQIKTDGTVIKKDGTLHVLKEGEYVDKEGNISTNPTSFKKVKL